MSHPIKLNSPVRDASVKSVQNNTNEYIGIKYANRNSSTDPSANEHRPITKPQLHHQSLVAHTQQLLNTTESMTNVAKRLIEFYQQAVSGDHSLDNCFLSQHQIKDSLLEQCAKHSVFHGSFFNLLLEQISQYKNNPHLQQSLSHFLRCFDLYTSQNETLSSLQASLQQLMSHFGESEQHQLSNLLQQAFQQRQASGEIQNLSTLKQLLLPILSKCASKNPENNSLRNQVMLCIHHLSRLDHASKDVLQSSLDQLLNDCQQFTRITLSQQDQLKALLLEQIEQAQAKETSLNSLVEEFKQQLSGDRSVQQQLVTHQFVQSYLLNKQILLPVLYGFVPLLLNDQYAFSEIWIDPEEKGKNSKNTAGTQVFFTIDLPLIGNFQCYLLAKNHQIQLNIEGPEQILPLLSGLEKHMKIVCKESGFQLERVNVSKLVHPKKFTEAFGHQILREVSVNVII